MYWDLAVDLYSKWGASGVVSYVERHRDRVSSEREIGGSLTESGFRSRSRYDVTVVNGHKVLDKETSSQ